MAANEITVKLDRVSKSFGEFTAVKELSLTVRAGQSVWTARSERRRQDHDDPDDRQHHRARFGKHLVVWPQDRSRSCRIASVTCRKNAGSTGA